MGTDQAKSMALSSIHALKAFAISKAEMPKSACAASVHHCTYVYMDCPVTCKLWSIMQNLFCLSATLAHSIMLPLTVVIGVVRVVVLILLHMDTMGLGSILQQHDTLDGNRL